MRALFTDVLNVKRFFGSVISPTVSDFRCWSRSTVCKWTHAAKRSVYCIPDTLTRSRHGSIRGSGKHNLTEQCWNAKGRGTEAIASHRLDPRHWRRSTWSLTTMLQAAVAARIMNGLEIFHFFLIAPVSIVRAAAQSANDRSRMIGR